jgi:hypothetical protein
LNIAVESKHKTREIQIRAAQFHRFRVILIERCLMIIVQILAEFKKNYTAKWLMQNRPAQGQQNN